MTNTPGQTNGARHSQTVYNYSTQSPRQSLRTLPYSMLQCQTVSWTVDDGARHSQKSVTVPNSPLNSL
ncbi:hypothetical protein DPMN_129896 [Dreissena polymorpha]|uniref:Uncharacterized protein n=1 Tax=Dreissena polymorpha TaxID=45954 RepID=A0A9D4H3N5_DREPO|nr:hypothetical protein DPMN_129896 [Dreissena polymorpha]